jgi:hypothetical protein
LARARRTSLTAVAFLTPDKAERLQTLAAASVASLGGEVAATLVQQLVRQLRSSLAEEVSLKGLLTEAYRQLPQPNHLDSIPGIGTATAAVLTAKVVAIDRFATPAQLVSYFGIFPQEESSGVGKDGRSKPGRQRYMSRKGNDLVRKYLWNAALAALRCNPAVRALYRRLQSRGSRGDVALGHCMRKLLHLAFAVWKSGKRFDPQHYPWEPAPPGAGAARATGHNRDDGPGRAVVTAAPASISPEPAENQAEPGRQPRPEPSQGGGIDFAALRRQLSMEQVLTHLGWLAKSSGGPWQRRGPCPIHAPQEATGRSFSVNLQKNVFRCFHRECAAQGNVLDLWAALRRLPLYEAARQLAETFGLQLPAPPGTEKRNPCEQPVPRGEAPAKPNAGEQKRGVITPDAP